MPGRLQNRVALITGASSGIGRATALAYSREGASVVCADISEKTWRQTAPEDEALDTTHERIKGNGGNAIYVFCDVTDPESVQAAVAAAVKQYGRLDIMVNNAGFAIEARSPAPIWDMPLDTLHRTVDANIKGVYYGIKYASAQMITQDPHPNGDRGWIINAASVFGLVGTPGASAYCTSKGAVANLTRSAAMDCAPYRIHVNAVNPGYTASHMTDELFGNAELKGQIEAMHPFRGVGRPEDIANAYVFLASDEAAWMTGVNLPVDGGFTAR